MSAPRAWSMIRPLPPYRAEAFMAGLRSAGFAAQRGEPSSCAPGDALLIWNRYGRSEQVARSFERAGGIVFVAENGYLGLGGSTPKYDVVKAPKPGDYYALALQGHNGAGRWAIGAEDRFAKLNVALHPWRTKGDHILICPSRGIGPSSARPPSNWTIETENALKRLTKRPVRVRQHPGNAIPARSIYEDLANAWFCVIWSSSAGVHALVNGVPVVALGPHWICKSAAFAELASVIPEFDADSLGAYRARAFRSLAWAQYTAEEISSGFPFRHLLGPANG